MAHVLCHALVHGASVPLFTVLCTDDVTHASTVLMCSVLPILQLMLLYNCYFSSNLQN